MVAENPKVIIVLPAYNAGKTLERTFRKIPRHIADEIILVDDASSDDTVQIARKLGITVHEHPQNRGYGANQKTCYRIALREGADIVVMLHPDDQYAPSHVPQLIKPIREKAADCVIGSRFLHQLPVKSGMPWWRYIANRCLTIIQNRVYGTGLSEFHSGYRAYSRRFLELVPFEKDSDDFSFDQEILAQSILLKLRIIEIPVPTYYFPEASSISFFNCLVYGCKTLSILAKFVIMPGKLVRK